MNLSNLQNHSPTIQKKIQNNTLTNIDTALIKYEIPVLNNTSCFFACKGANVVKAELVAMHMGSILSKLQFDIPKDKLLDAEYVTNLWFFGENIPIHCDLAKKWGIRVRLYVDGSDERIPSLMVRDDKTTIDWNNVVKDYFEQDVFITQHNELVKKKFIYTEYYGGFTI